MMQMLIAYAALACLLFGIWGSIAFALWVKTQQNGTDIQLWNRYPCPRIWQEQLTQMLIIPEGAWGVSFLAGFFRPNFFFTVVADALGLFAWVVLIGITLVWGWEKWKGKNFPISQAYEKAFFLVVASIGAVCGGVVAGSFLWTLMQHYTN